MSETNKTSKKPLERWEEGIGPAWVVAAHNDMVAEATRRIDVLKAEVARLKGDQSDALGAAYPSGRADASRWLPIAEAPKDGRRLLLGWRTDTGRWCFACGCFMSKQYITDNWDFPEEAREGWYEEAEEPDGPPNCWPIDPTHFVLIPPAQPPAPATEHDTMDHDATAGGGK